MRLSSQQRACHNLVQELDEPTSTTCTTRTSTTPSSKISTKRSQPRPAATTAATPPPPHPVSPSASPASGHLKSSQPLPPPQRQNLTLRGAPSPC